MLITKWRAVRVRTISVAELAHRLGKRKPQMEIILLNKTHGTYLKLGTLRKETFQYKLPYINRFELCLTVCYTVV